MVERFEVRDEEGRSVIPLRVEMERNYLRWFGNLVTLHPQGGILNTSNWSNTLKQTQDMLGGLYYSSGLEMTLYSPGGARGEFLFLGCCPRDLSLHKWKLMDG